MSADVALVCGATGTLGGAVVEELAARGDRVLAVARRPGEDAADVRFERADMSVPAEVDALWARLAERGERPRWVVNAVGGHEAGGVSDTDEALLRWMLDLNLSTALWSCRAAARGLEPGGAIVNVASRSAVSGGERAAAYAVAKAGVVRLTEVLAAELAPRRIRVNAILPSRLDAVPPSDVAAVVAFLCSDAAAAITGAAIPVYGWA
jgi:NAD(P)-dependent dehydrogenase (short-subunit alcohol dehydrogenase family)